MIKKKKTNQSSTNSLISIKKKKRANLRVRNKASYDQKVNKYLMSPYIENDPFIGFNKNHKQKMMSLAMKLSKKA